MPLNKAILRTLAYADVFDYPLTPEELYCFLIADRLLSRSFFKRALTRIKTNEKRIETNGEYFFLKDRRKTTLVRKKREKWSEEKLRIARRVGRWLRLVPWIKMVAVTGALAMKNSNEDDDIDLLIVTAGNRLWLTRFLVVLLVELAARRRRPHDQEVKDKICLNMFLDESHLCLPQKEQNLFTAHEVCQLKPLWSRNGIYRKFIEENGWVREYLPNWVEDTRILGYYDIRKKKKKSRNILISQYHNIVSLFERLAYQLQLAYMKPRKTTEIVEPHRLRFHPQDCQEWVLKEYQNTCKVVAKSTSSEAG